VLAGDHAQIEDLLEALHALGPRYVIVTGGHRDEAVDLLFDGTTIHRFPGERHLDGAAHGSGCTHSAALAAHLARGFEPLAAAAAARAIAARAVRDGLRDLGDGPGPVNALGTGTPSDDSAPRAATTLS
jgi:hydroxymethylpyrimidine/phosphomethylpyrimidine kinase